MEYAIHKVHGVTTAIRTANFMKSRGRTGQHWHKVNALDRFSDRTTLALLNDDQSLISRRPDGCDDSAIWPQLLDETAWEFWGRGGNENGIKRCVLLPTEVPIVMFQSVILQMQFLEVSAGSRQERLYPFD